MEIPFYTCLSQILVRGAGTTIQQYCLHQYMKGLLDVEIMVIIIGIVSR